MSPAPTSGPFPLSPEKGEPTVSLTLSRSVTTWPIARIVAGSFAAGLGLSIDAVEDFRLAVHEAVGLAAQVDGPDAATAMGNVQVEFAPYESHTGASGASATVTADVVTLADADTMATLPDRNDFGWLLLSEVSDDATAERIDGRLVIRVAVSGPEAA